MTLREIRIFCGQGLRYPTSICVHSLHNLKVAVTQQFENVLECSADHMNPREWKPGSLIVFPGGKCSDWDQMITGELRGAIANHVKEEGGRIFGFCAGAYYWVQTVKYNADIKMRPHFLSSWKCVGPIDPEITVEEILWVKTQQKIYVVVNHGGEFFPPESQDDSEILALYTQKKTAAVLFCPAGKGKLILAAPHLEYTPEDLESLKSSFPHLQTKLNLMQEQLRKTDDLRQKFLTDCFALLTDHSGV